MPKAKRVHIDDVEPDNFWRYPRSQTYPHVKTVSQAANPTTNIFQPPTNEPPAKPVCIKNLKPKDSLNIRVTVPAGQSLQDANFPKTFEFNQHDFNIISEVRVIVDPSGVYNVVNPEIVTVNGAETVIGPGYYDIAALMADLDGVIPTNGQYAFYFFPAHELLFPANSIIAQILGYPPNPEAFAVNANPYMQAGDPLTYPNPATSFPGQTMIDLSFGLNLLNVRCSLTNSANTFGNNYLTTVPISPLQIGQLISQNSYISKPIVRSFVSSVLIELFDRDEDPFKIQTPVIVMLQIDVYSREDN